MPHHKPILFKPRCVTIDGSGVVEIALPLKVNTRGNNRQQWYFDAKTAKQERDAAYVAIRALPRRPALPVKVTLTRYAPRPLDEFGNLPSSMKHVVDGIAEAYGVDDKRIDLYGWNCKQVKSAEYGVGIRIEAKGAM